MSSLTENRITVLGSGESGMGAALLAARQGFEVLMSEAGTIDSEKKAKLFEEHIKYEEKGHSRARIMKSDLVVKSPGIPNSASIIKELKEAKIPVISEIEFAYRYCTAKIIGITGSNGKTTTTLLTHHLLKSAGLDVGLGGNIGNSFSGLIEEKQHDYVVLELSSFQLDDIDTFKADTAVLLNITADHLDRYEYSIDKYADAKVRVFNNQKSEDFMIYNADDPLVNAKLASQHSTASRIGFSIEKTDQEVYLSDDRVLKFVLAEGNQALSLSDVTLIGKHNVYNTMAAVSVALKYGVSIEEIRAGLKSFKNAPHRLEYVDEVAGVRFVNDSKATNVDAVYYALEGIEKPIVWIAGGINKGNDYNQISDLVESKVKALICLGLDNDHLLQAFDSKVKITTECDTMSGAIASAFELAEEGDTVLLSPACSSFDLFENYEVRGGIFKENVVELKKKLNNRKEIV